MRTRHLKDAYLCSEPWCLVAADATAKGLQEKGALYLRSDDEQRTVMSGQVRGGGGREGGSGRGGRQRQRDKTERDDT